MIGFFHWLDWTLSIRMDWQYERINVLTIMMFLGRQIVRCSERVSMPGINAILNFPILTIQVSGIIITIFARLGLRFHRFSIFRFRLKVSISIFYFLIMIRWVKARLIMFFILSLILIFVQFRLNPIQNWIVFIQKVIV
jgi:hypothetical protein